MHYDVAADHQPDFWARQAASAFDHAQESEITDDGALAAYKKAKQLDPDSAETIVSLAILLEHDKDGKQKKVDTYRYAMDVLEAAVKNRKRHEQQRIERQYLEIIPWKISCGIIKDPGIDIV